MRGLTSQRIVIAALLFLGAVLRFANIGNVSVRSRDEQYYTFQALAWIDAGPEGLHKQAEFSKLGSTPPPLRVGMIRTIAQLIRWTGRTDEGAGVPLALAASIGALLIAGLIGIRFFPPWAAACGILFYAVSPAALAIARRTWTDAPVELASALLLCIACQITRDSRRLLWFPMLAVVGSVGITFKEAVLIPYGICGLWIICVVGIGRRQWRSVALLLGSAIVGLFAITAWTASSVGGWASLIQIVTGTPVSLATPYALECCWGPPNLLLQSFWIVSPVAALMSLVGLYALYAASAPQSVSAANQPVIRLIALFGASQIVLAMTMKGWLNLRYLAGTFPSFYLLAGFGFWFLAVTVQNRIKSRDYALTAVVAVAILIASAVGDYTRFQRVFVRGGLPDLSVRMIIDSRQQ